MSAGEKLTTLGRVKAQLAIPESNTDSDDMLNVLIKSASAFVLKFINVKNIGLTEYAETYDGNGNSWMLLRNAPVYDVSALSFSGSPQLPAQGDGFTSERTGGWIKEGRKIILYGKCFPRVRHAVAVKYRSGYVTKDELATVPADPYEVETSDKWLSNLYVTLADGTVLLEVPSTPADGEYSVSADGVYTFNAAQTGEDVLITYSGVPADIEQAVWEMVAERYKYKDRIGYSSKSLGGQETVAFTNTSMTSYIRELLNPYKQVVPV